MRYRVHSAARCGRHKTIISPTAHPGDEGVDEHGDVSAVILKTQCTGEEQHSTRSPHG